MSWHSPLDQCLLTGLEEIVRGHDYGDGFSHNMLQQYFGEACTAERYTRFNHLIVLAAWMLGYARLVME
jgi:hypothetical protein